MHSQIRVSAWRLCFVWMLVAVWPQAALAIEGETLTGGWAQYPPYSYEERVRGFPQWKGLDVELLRKIAGRAGYAIDSPALDWAEHVRNIETGETDFAVAATKTPEREAFANFSVPYRTETMALIVPRGQSASLPATTEIELVDLFKKTNFQLGIESGAAYPSEAIRAFLDDPANHHQLLRIGTQQDLLQNLIDGQIDGYLADRIVAATLIRANRVRGQVEEHPLLVDGNLHLMFSKASVPPTVVAAFDRAIDSVRADGTFRQINETYAFPILVALTIDSNWFLIVKVIGTIAFVFAGLLLAVRYDYDIFGALVLASLPAVGGGVVRDLITNRGTVDAIAHPIFIEIVVIMVIGGFVLLRVGMAIRKSRAGSAALGFLDRRREVLGYTIQVFDAIGLAAFTITGVVVAIGTQTRPLWLWGPIMAVITASAGGILRDVIRSDPDIPNLKGELYPEIAFVWGLILSLYMAWETRHLNSDEIVLGILVTFVGVFFTRMAIIHFGIRSPRFGLRSRGE